MNLGLQQAGTRPGGRCDKPPSRLQLITKRNIFAGKMCSRICKEWAADHFGLGLT